MAKGSKKKGSSARRSHTIPHDKFVRLRFRNPSALKDLLTLAFNERQLSLFNLDTIRLVESKRPRIEKGKIVDSATDFLISVDLNSDSNLSTNIIIEHKSFNDSKLMPQLFSDQVRCIEDDGNPVIPITLYHGQDPNFPRYKTFQHYQKNNFPEELIDGFGDVTINFGTVLIDLNDEATYAKLSGLQVTSRVSLQLMANIRTANEETLGYFYDEMEELEEEERENIIYEMALYIQAVHFESFTIEELLKSLNKRLGGKRIMQKIPEAWDMIIPIVEEKSRMEGFEEGRMEGVSAVAEKLIARGMQASEVSTLTGLSVEQIDEIGNNTKH